MMSDLCDDQVIHDNNYTYTYSLWGNSKYYDIKNLSPQNFANRNGTIGSEISQELKTSRWSSSPSEEPPPEVRDSRNRRVVNRESLYEDPDAFHKEKSEESPSKSSSFDWTQYYWHKATEKHQEFPDGGQGPSKGRKRQGVGPNNIQKNLAKMLAKPVKMTKAESMMQKMGWQGGALGRSGDGIVEPIAPNAVYAKTKIGFGQNHLRIPKNKKSDNKHFYEMNVLQNIYEFVTNNSEVELLFDKNLRKDERKRIHHLIQFKLKAEDLQSVDFDSIAQMDLVLQINNKNCYNLHTQSFGVHPIRQLCVFKLAPPHVYLVVPDDFEEPKQGIFFSKEFQLRNHEEEILKVEVSQEPELPPKDLEESPKEELDQEEETNPFLISITRNLKKKSESESQEDPVEEEKKPPLPEMSEITKKIVKFFSEFAEDKKYTQFKFLGPFKEEEIVAINEFIEQAIKYVSKEKCMFENVFRKVPFEINEDCTGNTVIYKRPV